MSPIPFQNQVADNFGSGISFYDFDKDGFDDITILDNEIGAKAFRNNGDSTFSLVYTFPSSSILKSVSWVDFDNDSDADIFFTCYNCSNAMYRNDGEGNFTIINDQFFPAMPSDYNTGHSWGDYDKDGWLDLYICIYNPSLLGSANLLYHNNGDGTFDEVGASLGVDNGHTRSFQSVWVDFDLNGWLDLYIINDKNDGNAYFLNTNGNFTPAPPQYGLNLQMDAMTASVSDFDNDLDFDLYITDISTGHMLMRKTGNQFSNVANAFGVEVQGGWGWGGLWIDSDLDGDNDLLVCNRNIEANSADNKFFIQEDNSFVDTGLSILDGSLHRSFAAAKGDFNGDGIPDMVMSNTGPVSTDLWSNQNNSAGNYLKIDLIGTISNRDGIGAIVHCYHQTGHSMLQTRCGENYLGQNSQHEIIGLGNDLLIDSLQIIWPSGWTDTFYALPANQVITITEGETFNVQITASANSICPSNPNQIELSVMAGLEWQWSNGQDSQMIVPDSAGTYEVVVTNGFGITGTASFDIEYIEDPLIGYELTSPSCYGEATGSIFLDIAVETNYNVVWSNQSFEISPTNIGAGIYNCTITDSTGCPFNYSFELYEPPPLTAEFLYDEIQCPGGVTEVVCVVAGGTGPINYDWGMQDSTALDAGWHALTLTDSNGCAFYTGLELTEPDSLNFNSLTPAVCYGETIVPSWMIAGGTSPYQVEIVGETTQELPAGQYDIIVSDANDCVAFANMTIEEYPELIISSTIINAEDGSNGSIELQVMGGTEPIEYFWSNGEQTNPLANIGQGYYQCVVSDANNCIAATENIYVLDVNIEIFGSQEFSIFPNPVEDHFEIGAGFRNTDEMIWIYDAFGKIIFSGQFSDSRRIISCQEWAPGPYFVRISNTTAMLLKL